MRALLRMVKSLLKKYAWLRSVLALESRPICRAKEVNDLDHVAPFRQTATLVEQVFACFIA
ncbi:hypothetical protein [Blastopirellula marina]|uniref:hypothetical protein n=1 Tax=Blastopirellula marina TaxID=124 RepID=UPI001304E8B8|nr:hypothetical protein [Blastopirellula marina]